MTVSLEWYVIPAAFALDLIFGDPPALPHPVRWMGTAIERLEPVFRKLPTPLTASGALFAMLLIVAAWAATLAAVRIAGMIHPALKTVIDIILIYYAISACALQSAALDVCYSLGQHSIRQARNLLGMIVGRETDRLSRSGMARAGVETVAENLVDGVMAPLFFAVLGGAPLAMAYKMVNTLDSMTGYKNDEYREFGKASARIDDVANFIPARLSVLVIALGSAILSRNGLAALKTGFAEGKNHASPNAGYPEAAFAGTLGVRLGGPNYYHGALAEKPWIGADLGEAQHEDIKKACDLMMLSAAVWVCLAALACALR